MAYVSSGRSELRPFWQTASREDGWTTGSRDLYLATRHAAEGTAAETASGVYAVPGRVDPAARPAGGGWPLLADDLFRLAHADDGSPVLHPDVAALGLGAALLGELILTGHVGARDGVVVVRSVVPPRDALAHTVLDHLTGEPVRHPVRVWLAFLAQIAYGEVALRMLRAGHVREETGFRVLRRPVRRYVPVDINKAAWPWARLSTLLCAGRRLDVFDTLLGGLVLATDLHRKVLTGATSDLTAGLRREVAEAPAAVRDLILHTEAVVGDAVATIA